MDFEFSEEVDPNSIEMPESNDYDIENLCLGIIELLKEAKEEIPESDEKYEKIGHISYHVLRSFEMINDDEYMEARTYLRDAARLSDDIPNDSLKRSITDLASYIITKENQ